MDETEKSIMERAPGLLESMLQEIPIVGGIVIDIVPEAPGEGVDFIVKIRVGDQEHELFCDVKQKVGPSAARLAGLNLEHIIRKLDIKATATGLLISSYLSPACRSICKEYNIGYLDFQGNARIAFNGVFVDREVSTRPATERRRLRSLFKPKSVRVLKKLLDDPTRRWRVTDLASEAKVSLGHISNIRKALLERELIERTGEGIYLREPDQLLDIWEVEYIPPKGMKLEYYTPLHGKELEDKLQSEMVFSTRPHMALGSFSAAEWLAPYTRYSSTMLYADKKGHDRLGESLNLKVTSKGSNVHLVVLEDRDILDDSHKIAGLSCTRPVQTYLDLASQGERGKEAADHLRSKLIKWDR
jgi:hypothetical protein